MKEWVHLLKTKRPSPPWAYLVAVLGLLVMLPELARAQANDAYGEALDQAVLEFNAGNYEEAHALFRHAHSLNPSARTWRSLGICAFELRLYVEAKTDLEAALADPRKPLTPAQRAEATSLLEKTRRFLSTYRVTIAPRDAQVEVDGKRVELLNGMVTLDPGTHVIVVRAPAYVEERRELRTGAGIREDLRFDLTKTTSHEAQSNTAAVSSQATARSDRDRPARRRRVWTWSLAAGAVAASAVAVGLRLRVNGLHDEFSDCTSQGGICGPIEQTGQHVLLGSRLSGALAGGLALGAVVAFFAEGPRRDSSQSTALLVGPRSFAILRTF